MCVIMLVNSARPTEEMIEKAWSANDDGGGVAYKQGDEIHWEKGIANVEDMKKLCAELPLPYVAHFRIASIGAVKPALTHPFPVGRDASLALKGRTKGGVLFHNGTWHQWQDKTLDAAIHANVKLPAGNDWSDSRAMAFLISLYGTSVMEMLPAQKGIYFTPKKLLIFTGGGWERVNGVYCSNDFFMRRTTGAFKKTYPSRMCRASRCTRDAVVGGDFCKECNDKKEAEDKSRTNGSTTALATVQGGHNSRPLMRSYTVQEVEKLHKANIVSKSLLKKFKKATHNLSLPGSRGERAKRQLQELSEDITERYVIGAGSVA